MSNLYQIRTYIVALWRPHPLKCHVKTRYLVHEVHVESDFRDTGGPIPRSPFQRRGGLAQGTENRIRVGHGIDAYDDEFDTGSRKEGISK
jgi:hypothetical protein